MVKATLLVVDDERTLLELYVRRLERLSYKVHPAVSGPEALEILQRENIDLLVTDFKMPGMNGLEVIARAGDINPMLQSIVVTGYSDLKTAIDVMGAGAFNYLLKPVDFKELDLTIGKGLEKRRLLQEVQNKQQQLREYRQHLEELVEKRTRALTETNIALKKEIEERKHLEISLREAKVLAENANKAKSEFLANMSHEIRTPMTSAIGLINLVLDTELLPKQKSYLEMARISTVVMHNLLNDILDFSKIEAGKLTLEAIPFDPRKVIESVIDLQHFQAEEKQIKLSSRTAIDVPHTVIGDPNRLRQILLNLVSNGIKFTPFGEVGIGCTNAIDEDQDLIPPDGEYQCLHFSVVDSGIGIEKDKIEHIFEAFTQADSSTTRKYGGVGLGLNICGKLVAMMGGQLWAVSEPGRGSTFQFTCKLGKVQAESGFPGKPQVREHPHAPASRTVEHLTVLLVEDNQSNQWVFRELLRKQGHMVVNVSDGPAALKEIKNRCFDLMLLDLRLPEMNGYEVANQIRIHECTSGAGQGQRLPIIAMTGYAGEDERKKCLAAGMDDYIAKPFTAGQLYAKIRKHIPCQATRCRLPTKVENPQAPNPLILNAEIFNEGDALRKAAGQREVMIRRIKVFLHKAPDAIELMRSKLDYGEKNSLEHEVHRLNELAMEAGATNFADELFSLIMSLRKNQPVDAGQLALLANEFEYFQNDPKILKLAGECR
jgi:two-component system, sensor histidine kinase